MAFALLRDAGCGTAHIERAESFGAMLRAGLNCPLSSGMGRLFDGAAAILGIKTLASYEGQGAVLLEAAAAESEKGAYGVVLAGEPLCFDWRPVIRQIVQEKAAGVSVDVLAARFLNTLIRMAAEQAWAVSRETGLRDVVLSGGSFQNQYIMRRLPELLRSRGLRVYHHSRVSTNDEGLSLGQVMIAAARQRD